LALSISTNWKNEIIINKFELKRDSCGKICCLPRRKDNLPRKKVKGHLVLIGGAEDKVYNKLILQDFFRLSGEENARIVVLPTASSFPGVGEVYRKIFSAWGARSELLFIDNRRDAESAEHVKILKEATGVFLTGGDQLKITSVLGGSQVSNALFQASFERGAVIGGTSAGAAAMSSHMIISGAQGSLPRRGMMEMAAGLGLLNWVIIDQHFAQRERIGRLLSAVAHNPALLGIGIDEDTAVIVHPDRTLKVIRNGTVAIVDGQKMEFTNIHQITSLKPMVLVNVTLHVLADGFRFDIGRRKVFLPKISTEKETTDGRRGIFALTGQQRMTVLGSLARTNGNQRN
jgi:cyanophycinase